MLLRQVQEGPLQGHRLRALRRRGDPLQGSPRAHGSHRPRRSGLPHLVLQGRPEPDRLPDRHGSEGAREGPLLRGLGDHLGRRGGSLEGPRQAREGSREAGRRVRARARAAHAGAQRVTGPPPRLPGRRRGEGRRGAARRHHRGLQRGRRALGRQRHQREADEGRGPRQDGQGAPQDLRGRDLGHRGLPRRGRRARARGLQDLLGDEAEGRDQRRDHVPGAQGPLRLAVRLGRVLPRRHGRGVDPRPARAGGPRRRRRAARGDDQHLEGAEAGPRGEAPQGRRRLPQVGRTSPSGWSWTSCR